MATMLGSLLISLGLDSAKFTKGMDPARRALVEFQKDALKTSEAMKDLGARMTMGITVPLAAFGGFAVKAASDAQELQSAFDQTFGALSKELTNWAETTGDAMGRSTQEIQQAANMFGIFFNQAAPTKQAAADLSKQFSVLAQDLSSFFNVDPTVAMQKLRSGLSGESEPLRDFGVFLTEASVKAKAFELGIAQVGSELTEQQKIMARAAMIMEATTKAQGDVARTADGTANRIRAARAAFEELQVAIGEKLIPAITPLIESITSLLSVFTAMPSGVQATVVAILGVAAAAGPLVYLTGSLKVAMITLAGAFTVNAAAAEAATLATGGLRTAVLTLQAALGPIMLVVGALGAAYLVMSANAIEARRETDALEASADAAEKTVERYRQKLEGLDVAADDASDGVDEATFSIDKMANKMLNAIGVTDDLIKKLKELGVERLTDRNAELELKKRDIEADVTRRRFTPMAYTPGGGGGVGYVKADNRTSEERSQLDAINREIKANNQQIGLIAEGIKRGTDVTKTDPETPSNSSSGATTKKTPSGRKGPTGPTSEEIASRFADEQLRLEMEALQVRQRLATSSEERADLDLQMLGLERQQRIAEIETSDFTAKQKDALRRQVEELYGAVPPLAEQGEIIVETNQGLIARSIRLDELYELERRAADAMRDQFELKRDHLQLDLELADTQEQRQRIAAEILRLEQEQERAQLEATIASKVAAEADKQWARQRLARLDGLHAKETAAGAKANRTESERYLDDLDMSVDEMNEAMEGIQIDGLEALNNGLVDAMMGVKSLGEVFKNVANQIIADLIRIAIRKAIIAPLANALFPEDGSGAIAGLGKLLGLDGARAMGGPVLAGGNYLVGENGPEIFSPGSSGTIIPNHSLGGGGGGNTYHFSGNLMTEEFWAEIQRGDMAAAQGGAQLAGQRAQFHNGRRW